MKKFLLLIAMGVIVLTTALVNSGDFIIEYGGSDIFTVATSGNVNVSGTIAENGVLLSNTYLALSGGTLTGNLVAQNITADTGYYFIGDGSLLTGVTVADDSHLHDYHNLTNIPTCTGNQHLTFDGTDLSCQLLPDNSINLAGENITSGTIAFARLPSLDDTHQHDYHNLTGIPTCSAGQHLFFDGTDMTCTDDAGDFTNVAYYNQTNTWAETQVFDKNLNVTGNVTLMTNKSYIKSGIANVNTTISIDSSGNLRIKLA